MRLQCLRPLSEAVDVNVAEAIELETVRHSQIHEVEVSKQLQNITPIIDSNIKQPTPSHLKGNIVTPVTPDPAPPVTGRFELPAYRVCVEPAHSSASISSTEFYPWTPSDRGSYNAGLIEHAQSPYQFREVSVQSEISSISSLRSLPDGHSRRLNPKIARIRNYEKTYTETFTRNAGSNLPRLRYEIPPMPKRPPPPPPLELPSPSYQRSRF